MPSVCCSRAAASFWFASRSVLLAAWLVLAAENACAQARPGSIGLTLEDAVHEALLGNRQIQISRQQVQSSEGQWLGARAIFDPTVSLSLGGQRNLTPLSDARQSGLGREQLRSEQLNLNASVRQQLRSGLAVQTFAELSHLRDENTLDFSTPGNGYASLGFNVDIPLGRGRGEVEVAAGERIAQLGRRAAQLDVGHQVALSTQQVISQYWGLRASERRLELARQSEARSQKLIDQLQQLIQKEQAPAVELNLALANKADKSSLRVSAEQNLRETRTQLGLLLGRDRAGMSMLGSTVDDFPPISLPQAISRTGPSEASLITRAQQQRLDLEAERLRRDSLAEAATAASQRARPDLTLSVGMRYRSLLTDSQRADLLRTPSGNLAGPSANATLQYRWPLEERQVQGDILDRNAQLDRQLLRLLELSTGIAADVGDAFQALLTSAELVSSADQSVRYYEVAEAAERRRYAMGMATLKNVLDTEDRLDAALQRSIIQRQDYARALTRLLFETGELVVREAVAPAGYRIALERLQGLESLLAPLSSSSSPP